MWWCFPARSFAATTRRSAQGGWRWASMDIPGERTGKAMWPGKTWSFFAGGCALKAEVGTSTQVLNGEGGPTLWHEQLGYNHSCDWRGSSHFSGMLSHIHLHSRHQPEQHGILQSCTVPLLYIFIFRSPKLNLMLQGFGLQQSQIYASLSGSSEVLSTFLAFVIGPFCILLLLSIFTFVPSFAPFSSGILGTGERVHVLDMQQEGPAEGWFHHVLPILFCQERYGYGSIPIDTIFRGMNIHLPAILMFTRGTRFWRTAIWFCIPRNGRNGIVTHGIVLHHRFFGSLLGPTNYKLNCAWLYGRSNELQQHFLSLQLLVHLSRFVVYSHQPKMVVVCDSLVIDAIRRDMRRRKMVDLWCIGFQGSIRLVIIWTAPLHKISCTTCRVLVAAGGPGGAQWGLCLGIEHLESFQIAPG